MTDEERMDAVLRQMAAEEYNRPPQIVPREHMWEAIQQGIGNRESGIEGDLGAAQVRPIISRVPRWVYYAVAAAALLTVGIQIGRLLSPATNPPIVQTPDSLGRPDSVGSGGSSGTVPREVAVGTERTDDGSGKGRPRPPREPERFGTPDDAASSAYTVAAAQHLTEVEAMLTAFKGDLAQGRADAQLSSWGKDLLSNTRLLLDSPAAKDPVRRKLLQDLELVLVQIVQLSPGASARDRDLIKGALTDDQVLTRLRTAIPVQKGT